MANTKVTGDVIANGTISTVHIADDAITAAKLDSTATGITFADLTVSATTATLNLSGSNTGASLINFGDSDDGNVGRIYYDHTSNFMQFKTNDSEKMRIDSSGNVGIGTASPAYKMTLSVNPSFHEAGLNTILNGGGANQELRIISDAHGGGGRTGDITFYTANSATATERMRIDSSGRLGLGVTPLTWSTGVGKVVDVMQLNGNGALFTRADQTFLSQNFYYNSSDAGAVIDAGQASIIQCNAGEILFSGTTTGASSGSTVSVVERMRINSAGNIIIKDDGNIYASTNNSTVNSGIYFGGSDNTLRAYTNDTERMRITSAGNVGIGDTNPSFILDTNITSSRARFKANTGDANIELSSIAGHDWLVQSKSDSSFVIYDEDAASERMRIDSSGNVGIRTTSPQAQLHINEDTSNSYATLRLEGANRGGIIDMYNQTSYPVSRILTDQSGNIFISTSGAFASTSLSEKFTILTGGNVGINTTSPAEKLHVENGNIRLKSNSDGNNGILRLYDAAGTESGQIYPAAGDLRLYTPNDIIMSPTGNVGIGTTSPDFALDIEAASSGVQLQIGRTVTSAGSTWMGSDSSGFHLGVGTYGVGNSVSDPNGFIVSTSGSMLLGFTTFVSLGTANHGVGQEPEGRVTVARGSNGQAARFYNSTGFAGDITLSGSSTSYNTSSDYRLKENVVELTGALDRVSQLKPSRFNFISDADKTVDGFLAHEVQDIVPEAITGEKDAVDEEGNPEYQGIDQSKLVPLLVGAIKELKADNDNLRARIEILENQ